MGDVRDGLGHGQPGSARHLLRALLPPEAMRAVREVPRQHRFSEPELLAVQPGGDGLAKGPTPVVVRLTVHEGAPGSCCSVVGETDVVQARPDCLRRNHRAAPTSAATAAMAPITQPVADDSSSVAVAGSATTSASAEGSAVEVGTGVAEV